MSAGTALVSIRFSIFLAIQKILRCFDLPFL